MHGHDGELLHVTLGERLLVLLLAKVVNLVPDGGIWMNTQRPEWNDANNALVGRGLSVVTLAYLRRYLDVVRSLLDTDLTVGVEIEALLTEVGSVLTAYREHVYRADQDSYLLYPDRDLPAFLDKNRVSAEQAARCPLIDTLVRSGDHSVVVRDATGEFRFAPGIHNVRDVTAALDALTDRAGQSSMAITPEDREALLVLFEVVFHHSEFTGRSGSFFAYEGLGSIYWHMVSKLLLAVQENLERAVAEGAEASVVDRLRRAYEDVRHGRSRSPSNAPTAAKRSSRPIISPPMLGQRLMSTLSAPV